MSSVCTCGGGRADLAAAHPATAVIDVAGAGRAMDGAKAMLAERIAEHMAERTTRAERLRMSVVRFDITPPMVEVLEWLWRVGTAAALAEGRALGVQMARPFWLADASSGIPRLRRVVLRLRSLLDTLQVRTERDLRAVADEGLDVAAVARTTALRRLSEYPGALDAASRLVSSAYTAGLDDIYSANADLFGGWVYTSVLDGGTCNACRGRNGEQWETLAEALAVMPGFGPNPDCYGRGRCRCRLAALPPR